MAGPDYLICLDCETPTYVFEWDGNEGVANEAICETCGNEDPEQFLTPEDFDALAQ